MIHRLLSLLLLFGVGQGLLLAQNADDYRSAASGRCLHSQIGRDMFDRITEGIQLLKVKGTRLHQPSALIPGRSAPGG